MPSPQVDPLRQRDIRNTPLAASFLVATDGPQRPPKHGLPTGWQLAPIPSSWAASTQRQGAGRLFEAQGPVSHVVTINQFHAELVNNRLKGQNKRLTALVPSENQANGAPDAIRPDAHNE